MKDLRGNAEEVRVLEEAPGVPGVSGAGKEPSGTHLSVE